jgi:hypothetical protein
VFSASEGAIEERIEKNGEIIQREREGTGERERDERL